jgi:GTP cyclohydrolase I
VRTTHSLTVSALCPKDGLPDIYAVTVTTERVVAVEDILKVSHGFARRKIYQEDLTKEMARKLGVTVKSLGYHSGVRTECEA